MSRIGKKPIDLPTGVSATVENNDIIIKGPKGILKQAIFPEVTIKIENSKIVLEKSGNTPKHDQMQGLLRTLIANMVEGVSNLFSKTLEMKGVGFKAQVKGKNLIISAGFSHPIELAALPNIEYKVEDNTRIIVSGIKKDQVGQIAATIKAIRKPEPYKGKGIYYIINGKLETIIRKEGKRAAASAK